MAKLDPKYLGAITPADLGFPAKYEQFRPQQQQALQFIHESSKPFVALNAPLGSGKTGIMVAHALLMEETTALLTATRYLQDQLREFHGSGMVDIRGRDNYMCRGYEGKTCKDASGSDCYRRRRAIASQELARGGRAHAVVPCPYEERRKECVASILKSTNYAYWCRIMAYTEEGLGPVTNLVCDEADRAPDEVCRALSFNLRLVDCHNWLDCGPLHNAESYWLDFAADNLGRLAKIAEDFESAHDGKLVPGSSAASAMNRLKDMVEQFGFLAANGPRGFVMGRPRRWGMEFTPLRAADFARSALFHDCQRVVLMSGTLTKKTLELLGLTPDEYDFRTLPYTFPRSRGPVIHIRSGVADTTKLDADPAKWHAHVDRIDEILDPRQDRRAIIHTHSYRKQERLAADSVFSDIMLAPGNSKDLPRAIAEFLQTPPPVALLSPAISTGVDFPYDACELNIITKVPFPDRSDEFFKRRSELDHELSFYYTVMALTQMLGRAMRAADDRCETFVIDDRISWVLGQYKHLFPVWARSLVSTYSDIPKPYRPSLWVERNGNGVFRTPESRLVRR